MQKKNNQTNEKWKYNGINQYTYTTWCLTDFAITRAYRAN